jgi:hypothetical protein
MTPALLLHLRHRSAPDRAEVDRLLGRLDRAMRLERVSSRLYERWMKAGLYQLQAERRAIRLYRWIRIDEEAMRSMQAIRGELEDALLRLLDEARP